MAGRQQSYGWMQDTHDIARRSAAPGCVSWPYAVVQLDPAFWFKAIAPSITKYLRECVPRPYYFIYDSGTRILLLQYTPDI